MRRIILIILILFSLSVQAQIKDSVSSDTTRTIIEVAPVFPGGVQNIYKIIEENLQYPKSAIKDKVGGKVITQFVVDTLGNVRDIEILKGIRQDIDDEAMRLIGLLNGWTPGIQDGRKVKVRYVLPLTFFPSDKWKRKYKRLN